MAGIPPRGRRVATRPDEELAPVDIAVTSGASVRTSRGAGRGRGRIARPQEPPQPGLEKPPIVKKSPTSSPDSERKLLEKMRSLRLTDRPDKGGSVGRRINLIVNQFQIYCDKMPFTVHQYFVETKGERFRLTREEEGRVFWQCVRQYTGTVFSNPSMVVFDGHTMCFCLDKIKFPDDQYLMYDFDDVEVQLERDMRVRRFSVIMQYTGPTLVDVNEVVTNDLIERRTTPIQVVELIYKQAHSCQYAHTFFTKFGSNFYLKPYANSTPSGHLYPLIPLQDIYTPLNISKGRELWHGYFCSAKVLCGNKMWLNVNSAVGAYYKCQSVLDFICELLKTDQKQLTRDGVLQPFQIRLIENELKGLLVRPIPKEIGTGQAARGGTFKVVGMSTQPVCELTFMIAREGQEPVPITVEKYFNDDGRTIRFPMLPAILIGKKDRYMPVEHCIIEKGQKVVKKFDEIMTSKIIKEAAVPAPTRIRNIVTMVEKAQLASDAFAARFGMKMSSKPAEVVGRVLPPPRILYANNRSVEPQRGSWAPSQGQVFQMLVPATFTSYALLAFGSRERLERVLMNFCEALAGTAGRMGIRMPHWPEVVEYLNGLDVVEPTIKGLVMRPQPPQLTIVVLPAKNSPVYPTVKRVAEIETGLMTQCITIQNVQNAKDTVMENLLLKINMKIGGRNNKLGPDERIFRSIMEKGGGTLVLGIDLIHPGPKDERSPSIAAVVGNVDVDGFAYRSTVKIQKHRRENLVYLNDAVHERLLDYFKISKKKPTQIVVFRDGVADGQFRHVLSEELEGIKAACQNLSNDYRPGITYVVVQKRHQMRMFVKNERDGVGKAINVPPGTCLDQELVHPTAFDFYLTSQFGIQGTSVPAHYWVLYDDNNFSSDEIEAFTFCLTHLYGRCPRSVKIPAPTYFADLVCRRAHGHLMKMIGDTSETASMVSGEFSQPSSLSEPLLTLATTVKEQIKNTMYFA